MSENLRLKKAIEDCAWILTTHPHIAPAVDELIGAATALLDKTAPVPMSDEVGKAVERVAAWVGEHIHGGSECPQADGGECIVCDVDTTLSVLTAAQGEVARLEEEIRGYNDLAVRLAVVTEERDAARGGVPVDKFLQKKVDELRAECDEMTGQFTATAADLKMAREDIELLDASNKSYAKDLAEWDDLRCEALKGKYEAEAALQALRDEVYLAFS